MRTIHTDEIIKNIKEMCIEANLSLTEDMKCRFKNATEYGNCSSRSDSNLSGYRNGNRIFKYRTGCSY